MRLIVSGGAGYIGSHMSKLLAENGHKVGVVDNFSTGYRQAVRWGKLYEGDIRSAEFLDEVFEDFNPEGVLHFAAKSQVGESLIAPAEYFSNNVAGTLSLLERVRKRPGCLFVFSSTAAIFGNPQTSLLDEQHPRNPINPYGRTKLSIEYALQDYYTAYAMPSISFRYFNAAGADPSGVIGEAHDPETHLIPLVLESVLGRGSGLKIFGDDYETHDGTCIRDYIHVNDLCAAHLLGINYLQRNPGAHFYNLGNGNGFSVRQVLSVAEQVVGQRILAEVFPRRAGDPASLVAQSTRAKEDLGWTLQFPAIEDIISTAWHWHRSGKFRLSHKIDELVNFAK